MANQKISELTALSTAEGTDVFPIVDSTDDTTKKISLLDVKESMQLNQVDNTSDLDKPISDATQIALNGKAPLLLQVGNISEDYTIGSGDEAGLMIIVDTSAGDVTITVPEDATYEFPSGTQMLFVRGGENDVFVVGDGGVTIAGPGADDKIATEAGVAALVKIAPDIWIFFGDVA
jgi:hypothetical protein